MLSFAQRINGAVEALVAPPQEAVLSLNEDGQDGCSTSGRKAQALW
jgi:hypothetical protein